MSGLMAASGGSAWSYGGSLLTFLFPMILFIAVAGALYVLYSKPHMVPGHRYLTAGRPATATPMPHAPGREGRGDRAATGHEGHGPERAPGDAG